MIITFDLDTVIFDIEPLYKMAFENTPFKYKRPISWELLDCYDKTVVDKLLNLFASDYLYSMKVNNKQIPVMINKLLSNPEHKVFFVTERRKKQPEKTYQQLLNAGIKCTFDQVIDKEGLKSDILLDLKTDMHFDDSPYVIGGCLDKNVPIIMISNNKTLYNHFLRDKVEHYNTLQMALKTKGLIR